MVVVDHYEANDYIVLKFNVVTIDGKLYILKYAFVGHSLDFSKS